MKFVIGTVQWGIKYGISNDSGIPNSEILYASKLTGVTNVFPIGGSQAIAALAFGTETIPKVDLICGPGNTYVTEAKRQVFGTVGIDGIYGPTETLIIADHSANPTLCAADLIAQAEHDYEARPIPSNKKHKANDSTSYEYATTTDPVYYMEKNYLNVC